MSNWDFIQWQYNRAGPATNGGVNASWRTFPDNSVLMQ
jgi:hypothetical protein